MENEAVKALEPGIVINGRYRVMRCIKAGGMGAVYEVSDVKTRRRLALKTLRPGVVPDTALLSRFEQEASITAELDSEHVVKVEDFGLDPGTQLVFFTMELLSGCDLGALLEEQGPLPADRVANVVWQVGRALSTIHDAGIVHRDLKPENLFLKRRDDAEGFVKILDFGVAKALESDPRTTALVGTPLYMPPEQLRGEPPDARTDVYALGQVAFTLLTCHPYLERGYPHEPARARASRFGIRLPSAFDAWFERATAAEPARRFDTAIELALELFEALDLTPPARGLEQRRPPRQAAAPELRAARVVALGSQSTVAVASVSRPAKHAMARVWLTSALALALVGAALAFTVRRSEQTSASANPASPSSSPAVSQRPAFSDPPAPLAPPPASIPPASLPPPSVAHDVSGSSTAPAQSETRGSVSRRNPTRRSPPAPTLAPPPAAPVRAPSGLPADDPLFNQH